MEEKALQISKQIEVLDGLANQILDLQESYMKDYEAQDAFAIGAIQGIQKAHLVVKRKVDILRDELAKLVVG